jgi:hypothetical protein
MKRRKLGTLEVSGMEFGCMNASGNYGPAPDKNQGMGVQTTGCHSDGLANAGPERPISSTSEIMKLLR